MEFKHKIEDWRHYSVCNELREIRKLLSVIQTWGNVLVNGNITAAERMGQLVDILKANGIENEKQAEQALIDLELFYPSHSQEDDRYHDDRFDAVIVDIT